MNRSTTKSTSPMESTQPSTKSPGRAERRRIAKAARALLARRHLADFVRQAIAAGAVHGLAKVEWGPHLDALCFATQMQLESWLVAYGHGTPEMIERQARAWQATGAVWEDGQPEPWLRYVLVQNEVDNMPPGTLKSTIVMICANAWIWLWCETFAWGAASGIDANVSRDSNATRDLVRSKWYRETFGIVWDASEDLDPEDQVDDSEDPEIGIRSDNDAVSDWSTTAGGRRYSRTVQRGFTGMHVDGTFIDDPDDADKVWNEAARLRPQNRFTRAIENRVNDEHRSIRKVMQQVVHVEGFSAYLLSIARWSPQNPKGWAQLCIPAEFGFQPEEAPRETPYGWKDWRTTKGEIIHPRLSPGVLADKRSKLPGYEGQYNQNAQRTGSGMFEWRLSRFFVFQGENVATLRRRPELCPSRIDQPPVVIRLEDLDRITLSIDAANSLNPNPADGKKISAVGLIVGGCRDEQRFILDDRTRVLGPSKMYRAIFDLIRAWPLGRILVELKAMGPSVIDELTRAIRRGWYLDPDTDERIVLLGPDGDPTRAVVEAFDPGKDSKEQRAHGMLPPWEQGLMFFHDGAPWLYPQVDENRKTVDEGCLGEVCTFPASRRTDRVDSISQLVAKYRKAGDARARWLALSS